MIATKIAYPSHSGVVVLNERTLYLTIHMFHMVNNDTIPMNAPLDKFIVRLR